MQLIEHCLRPLSHPSVQADVVHVATNGLGVLPALTAKWQYGTPMIVSEHGIYLREQYLHSPKLPYRWPVKAFYLGFLRQICALGYHEAESIVPCNVYNRRWRNGSVPTRRASGPCTTAWTRLTFPSPTMSPKRRRFRGPDALTRLRTWKRCCRRLPLFTRRCRGEAAAVRLGAQGPGILPGTLQGIGGRARHRSSGDVRRPH